jgi:hypothetical protein
MRNSFVKFSGKENACPSKETIAEMRAKFRQHPLSIDSSFNPLSDQNCGYNSTKNANAIAKPELPTVSTSTKAQRSKHFSMHLSSGKLSDFRHPQGQGQGYTDGLSFGRTIGLKSSVNNFGDVGGLGRSVEGGLTKDPGTDRSRNSDRLELKSWKTLIASPVRQIIKSSSFSIPAKYAVNYSEVNNQSLNIKSEKRISGDFEKKVEPNIEYDCLSSSLITQSDPQDKVSSTKNKGTPSKQRELMDSPSYETPDFPVRHKHIIESFGKRLDGMYESILARDNPDTSGLNGSQLSVLLRMMGIEGDSSQDHNANEYEKGALLKILMHGLKTDAEDEISYPILRMFLTTVYALQRQKVWDRLNLSSEARTYNSPQTKKRASISQFSSKFYSFSKTNSFPDKPSLQAQDEDHSFPIKSSGKNTTSQESDPDVIVDGANVKPQQTTKSNTISKSSTSINRLTMFYNDKPTMSLQELPTLDIYSSYMESQPLVDSSQKQSTSLSNQSCYKMLRQQKLLHKNHKSSLYLDGDMNAQKSLSRQTRFHAADSLLVYDLPSDNVSIDNSFECSKNKTLSITKICRTLCEFHDSKAKTVVNNHRGDYQYCVIMRFTSGRKHLPVHANDFPEQIMAAFLQKYRLDKSSKAHLQCYLANDPKPRERC